MNRCAGLSRSIPKRALVSIPYVAFSRLAPEYGMRREGILSDQSRTRVRAKVGPEKSTFAGYGRGCRYRYWDVRAASDLMG